MKSQLSRANCTIMGATITIVEVFDGNQNQ